MKNKTIVFVVNTLAIGGAAKIVTFVANIAVELFNNVYILVYDEKGSIHKLNQNIKVINLHLNQSKNKRPSSFISVIIQRFQWIRAIRHEIKTLQPDVIMPFITDVIIDTYLAMIGYNALYLAAERGDPTSYPIKWKILSKLIYPLYKSIVFQTEGAKQTSSSSTQRKATIIKNPFLSEIEYSEPFQGEREKYIVSAGRFVPEKGFSDLIKAFKTIHTKFPNYKLLIYGEGYLKSDLESLVYKLNLVKSVELRGYEKNISEIIYKKEVFVLSSVSEGIPNMLIEAMSLGIPVVSTNCKPGGAASLIRNGENGIIVPISNPHKLAEAIEHIIINKEYASKLGQEAFKIKEELNSTNITKEWINYFNLQIK